MTNEFPDDGWADMRIAVAAVVLAMFGDGYAMLSINWPYGIPAGALPDPFAAAQAIKGAEIDRWCGESGHELALGAFVAAPQRPGAAGSGKGQYQTLASRGLAADPVLLRAAEQPDWVEYEAATRDTAAQLRRWLAIYRGVLDGNAAEAPASSPSPNAPPLSELAMELGNARRVLPDRNYYGAQAEAVIATGFIAQLVRGVLMLTTSPRNASRSALHLMTLDALESAFRSLGLDTWLSANAPPAFDGPRAAG